jgi:hypothetical protein
MDFHFSQRQPSLKFHAEVVEFPSLGNCLGQLIRGSRFVVTGPGRKADAGRCHRD